MCSYCHIFYFYNVRDIALLSQSYNLHAYVDKNLYIIYSKFYPTWFTIYSDS